MYIFAAFINSYICKCPIYRLHVNVSVLEEFRGNFVVEFLFYFFQLETYEMNV